MNYILALLAEGAAGAIEIGAAYWGRALLLRLGYRRAVHALILADSLCHLHRVAADFPSIVTALLFGGIPGEGYRALQLFTRQVVLVGDSVWLLRAGRCSLGSRCRLLCEIWPYIGTKSAVGRVGGGRVGPRGGRFAVRQERTSLRELHGRGLGTTEVPRVLVWNHLFYITTSVIKSQYDAQSATSSYNRTMHSYAYGVLLFASGIVPLCFALARWRFGWGKTEWVRLAQVFLLVSVPFVLLDSISHSRGWWTYNPSYITGAHFLGLPLEEIAFFFVVPFACLYVYHALAVLRPDAGGQWSLGWALRWVVLGAAVVLAVIEPRERTLFDLVLFLTIGFMMLRRPFSRIEVTWLMIVVGLFLIVNTVLTALPIVIYDIAYGSRLRIGTIPFEDVLYNFSLLLLCLAVWRNQPLKRVGRRV